MSEPILQVKDVVKHYPLTRGIIFKKQIGQVRRSTASRSI